MSRLRKPDEADRVAFSKLSPEEKEQRRLYCYFWNHRFRHRSAAHAGRAYERYVGYLYERKGYEVVYRGIELGREDRGIDLVCLRGETLVVVQCKNWLHVPLTDREVAHLYGAVEVFYRIEAPTIPGDLVARMRPRPVIATTGEVFHTARHFSRELQIRIARVQMRPYPAIKCIAGSGKYHLPFHAHYDRTKVLPARGDCFVTTIAEARGRGFLPARY